MKQFIDEIKYDAAFIKGHTLQPRWYKILKVFLIFGFLGGYSVIFGGVKTLVFCLFFFGLSIILHLVYRIKTQRFSRSWLDFRVEDKDGQLEYQRIGIYYYLSVAAIGVIAFTLSQYLVG